jgi:hypothetical protein
MCILLKWLWKIILRIVQIVLKTPVMCMIFELCKNTVQYNTEGVALNRFAGGDSVCFMSWILLLVFGCHD